MFLAPVFLNRRDSLASNCPGSFKRFCAFTKSPCWARTLYCQEDAEQLGFASVSARDFERLGRPIGPETTVPPEAPVAQLDRALDYESRGREFESLRARHFGTKLGPPKPAVVALEAATSVRSAFRPHDANFFRIDFDALGTLDSRLLGFSKQKRGQSGLGRRLFLRNAAVRQFAR